MSVSSSNLINKAVEQLSRFPGVGKKSALRMALFLLKRSEGDTIELSDALLNLSRAFGGRGERVSPNGAGHHVEQGISNEWGARLGL